MVPPALAPAARCLRSSVRSVTMAFGETSRSYSGYRREFVDACPQAGVEGRTTHDFRRTVARDLRLAGVPETVCMTITGHESSQVFRRYAGIIDPKEQEAAFVAREALL